MLFAKFVDCGSPNFPPSNSESNVSVRLQMQKFGNFSYLNVNSANGVNAKFGYSLDTNYCIKTSGGPRL